MHSDLIPLHPPTGQLLADEVDEFLNKFVIKDVTQMAESFDSQRRAIQAMITHYIAVGKEKKCVLQKVLKLQKPQKMEEAKLADRKQALKQQEERVRAKKQELKLKKELWISPSDVWKSQGLELIMLQGKEKGDPTPESGDEPVGSQSDDRIADGLYQVTLSNIPGSGSEFRFKISYEKGCCSILEADSRLFAVQEITTIESAAGKNDCRLLILLLRRHIIDKLKQQSAS